MTKLKKAGALLAIFLLLGLATSCSNDNAQTLTAKRPMIMVEGVVFMDTGKKISIEIEDDLILGTITSSVDVSKTPTQNGESNFGFKGSQYAYYENDLVVSIDNQWVLFENELGETNIID